MTILNPVAPSFEAEAEEHGSDSFGALAGGWASEIGGEALDNSEPKHEEPDTEEGEPEADDEGEAEPEEDDQSDPEEDADEEDDDSEESDEDEDEDDDDSDGDDDSDEDNGNESKDDKPRTFKVMDNGQEREVTEAEMRDGYLRQQDYTRKTMELAEHRRNVQQAEQNAQQSVQQWAQGLQQLNDVISAQLKGYSDSDLAKLKENDPYAYSDALEKRNQLQQNLQEVQQNQQATQQHLQQQQSQQYQQWVQSENQQLQSKLPEWLNSETRSREVKMIRDYGREMGMSEQEVNSIADHRHILMMRDAARYRQSQQKAETAKSKVAKARKAKKTGALKPGQTQSAADKKRKSRSKSMDRFKKSGGSIEAATDAFADFLSQ